MKATRNVLAALCALAECGPLWATNFKEAAEMTVPREYRTSDGEVFRYRWAEPEKTEFGRRYPIVVLLHGAGERGTNNVDQLVHGAGPLLLYMKERGIAGYFLAGQMPCGEQWVNTPYSQTSHRMPKEPSTQMARLFETLDAVMREFPIDADRVYVTGVSMGGYGTWDAIQRRPGFFAAAMPVCGGGDTHLAWTIREVPIWAWHGDNDGVVPPCRSRSMVSALWDVDGNVRYTEVAGRGHAAWLDAYAHKPALDWLFAQRRIRRPDKAEMPRTRISVFDGDIAGVAKERGVSIPQAAALVMACGVAGFDCDFRNPAVWEMIEGGLRPVNFYGSVDFSAADGGAAAGDAFIQTALRHEVPRIMVVVEGHVENADGSDNYEVLRDGLSRLAKKARAAGIVPMIEDFGMTNNVCSRAAVVRRFLSDIPELDFTVDSGNTHYAGRGDSIVELACFARGRISHVHLKDASAEDGRKFVSLGLGAVPNAGLVRMVNGWGYDGWYTLENPVGADRLEDIRRQVSVLRYWCGEAGCHETVPGCSRPKGK